MLSPNGEVGQCSRTRRLQPPQPAPCAAGARGVRRRRKAGRTCARRSGPKKSDAAMKGRGWTSAAFSFFRMVAALTGRGDDVGVSEVARGLDIAAARAAADEKDRDHGRENAFAAARGMAKPLAAGADDAFLAKHRSEALGIELVDGGIAVGRDGERVHAEKTEDLAQQRDCPGHCRRPRECAAPRDRGFLPCQPSVRYEAYPAAFKTGLKFWCFWEPGRHGLFVADEAGTAAAARGHGCGHSRGAAAGRRHRRDAGRGWRRRPSSACSPWTTC